MAISQPLLDMPELLWKAYIDFEIEENEFDNVRALYRRLLDRTRHVKVWISFAQFERDIENTDGARKLYDEGFLVCHPTTSLSHFDHINRCVGAEEW